MIVPCCYWLKVRVRDEEAERQRSVFAASRLKWSQWPELSEAKARASSGSAQALGPASAGFSQTINRELHQKWRSQDVNQHPHKILASQVADLLAMPQCQHRQMVASDDDFYLPKLVNFFFLKLLDHFCVPTRPLGFIILSKQCILLRTQ